MAFPIIPKLNSAPGAGAPATLTLGELAGNRTTGTLFMGTDTGVRELAFSATVGGTVISAFTADGSTSYHPLNGYSSTAAGAYLVSVAGIEQRPTVDWTVSSANSGTVVFATAPPVGAAILVRGLVASSSGGGGGGGTDIGGRAWDAAATYTEGDLVATAQREAWICIQAANTGHDPTASPSWWQPLPADAISLQLRTVATTAPTDGQALVWASTATEWQPGDVLRNQSTATDCLFIGAAVNPDFTQSNSVNVGTNASAFQNSVSVGTNASSVTDGVAVGLSASTGYRSVAVGKSANAVENAVAIGGTATANNYGIAIGYNVAALENAIGIGGTNASAAAYGIALGDTAAAGEHSVSVGGAASAGVNAVSVGSSASAGTYSVALGKSVTAADLAIAIGGYGVTAAQESVAIGYFATAGYGGIAIGTNTSTAANSIRIGDSTQTFNSVNVGQFNLGTMKTDALTMKNKINEIITFVNTKGASIVPL